MEHVQGRDPLGLLDAAQDTLAALLARTLEPAVSRRPTAGKWSTQESVAHIAEGELVGAYRILLMLSELEPAVQAFDQYAWAVSGRYSQTETQISLSLFRSLRSADPGLWCRLTPDERDRGGIHAERCRESIRDIAVYYAGDDLKPFRAKSRKPSVV